jgi:hypothetical protein
MRIKLGPEIDALCYKLNIRDKAYVRRISITPKAVEVEVFKGSDGPYRGPKYVACENGRRAWRGSDGRWYCVCPSGGITHDQSTYDMATDTYTMGITT